MTKEAGSGRSRLVQDGNTGIYSFENLSRRPGEEQRLIDDIMREVERLRELDRQTKAIP
ncbi:MAG: hypothetical protein UV74_C0006G0006 [Candidatus Woesebacteria bacterium GW2011_GWB1_43_14]|uniref:Uncharacterized protein n=1 Tax=Candidatus Woesebacteria bacterium GW2011_GWB1_43_14 TaxID=1618578 RepID=A0A0G1DK51_9BACT|nr:MAG: hypothetical protein UV74_C0006G0006 [Candidatus Woesebacteria bacterium GW2011_GWB1_43_14]